jgi:EAL domain-containing protein (putative c-di-GMP-specific phosphodiesterase class I)
MAERDTLTELGCDLLQGYLFGHATRWPTMPEFVTERPRSVK